MLKEGEPNAELNIFIIYEHIRSTELAQQYFWGKYNKKEKNDE